MIKKILKNYLFAILLITLSASCLASGFVLDPGDSGNGDGDADITPPYVAIRDSTGGIITQSYQFATVKVVASDLEELDYVKIYVDNVYKETFSSGSYDYNWDVSGYNSKSIHTVKAIAYDKAGNSRAVSKSYIIGYSEDTQHYLNPIGRTGPGLINLGTIAYTIIESDLFCIIMQIHGWQMTMPLDQTRTNVLDVTMMYYCKDTHRLDYNLDSTERPLTAPDGTLMALNFEMEETNINLADHSFGRVMQEEDNDRLFWPNFNTPDKVAATDLAITVLSWTIGAVVTQLDLSKLAGFAVGKAKDYFIDELRAGNVKSFRTGEDSEDDFLGAIPVDIVYRNQEPGQNVKYPDNKYNYAYDAISRHRIYYRYHNWTELAGQTLGIKFRCNAEYVDSRDTTICTIFSEWVKVEFKLD